MIILVLILVERSTIRYLIIMRLTIVGLMIPRSNCFPSIAIFSKRVVEIMTVIANPILISICGFCRILHARKRSILFNTFSYIIHVVLKTKLNVYDRQ